MYNIRWNPNEPRFIVTECEECSDDKVFQNNKCVFNQRLGLAYSIDDIVEILNNTDGIVIENFNLKKENKEFKEENEWLKKDRFICLDCEHSGCAEIGCLCEYTDHWQEHITECEDFKELQE